MNASLNTVSRSARQILVAACVFGPVLALPSPLQAQDRRPGDGSRKPTTLPGSRGDNSPRTNPAPNVDRRNDGGQRTPPAPASDRRPSDRQQSQPAPAPDRRPGGGQQTAPPPQPDRRPVDNTQGNPALDRRPTTNPRTNPAPVLDRRPTDNPQVKPAPRPNPQTGNGQWNRPADVRPTNPGLMPEHRPNNTPRPSPAPPQVRQPDAHSVFTHSAEGRQFANGARLRQGLRPPDRRLDAFFPAHVASYPYYSPTFAAAEVTFSPFRFYAGISLPWIYRSHVHAAEPSAVYVEVPVYVNDEWQGYGENAYYLDRPASDRAWLDEPGLQDAVSSLENAFRDSDIEGLAALTDPDASIAVFGEGVYQYSVGADDYLDMTRDFMRTAQTTDFAAYRVSEKTPSVYQVFAKHTYLAPDGQSKSVYLCIAMERAGGRWIITQIDTSPEHQDD